MEEEQINLKNISFVIKKRKKIIISVLGVMFLLGLLVCLLVPPFYQSKAKVLIVQKEKGMSEIGLNLQDSLGGLGGSGTKRTSDTQIEIIKSRPRLEEVIKKLNLSIEPENLLKRHYKVKQFKKTDIIVIYAVHQNKEMASKMANLLALAYVNFDSSLQSSDTKIVTDLLQEQIKTAKIQLNTAEESLRDFKKKHKLTDLEEDIKRFLNNYAALETQKVQTEAFQKAQISGREKVREALARESKMIVSSTSLNSNPLIANLNSQLSSLEIKKAGLLQEYTEQNPRVTALNKEIEKTRSELKKQVQMVVGSQVQSLNPIHTKLLGQLADQEVDVIASTARLNAYNKVLSTYEQKIKDTPDIEYQYMQLYRGRLIQENLYKNLQQKYQESLIKELTEKNKSMVKIIEPAIPSKRVYFPRLELVLPSAVILGLFISFLIIFILEQTDTSIKTSNQVYRILNMSTIGFIPSDKQGGLITDHAEDSFTEAYRSLRSNINFLQLGNSLRSVLVTSASTSEGKSLTAANLGIALAKEKKDVLLVDCDLRAPSQHKLFNLANSKGLADILEKKEGVLKASQPSSVKGLSVITSGQPEINPADLLDSSAMVNFIEETKKHFDMVIFDAPACNVVTDANILASKIDGTLLIVEAGRTTKEEVTLAKNSLSLAKANLLGIVLNKAEIPDNYYYRAKSKAIAQV